MKKILMICLALVMGLGMCAAAGKPAQKKEVTTVFVTDIDCEHCVKKIMNNVARQGHQGREGGPAEEGGHRDLRRFEEQRREHRQGVRHDQGEGRTQESPCEEIASAGLLSETGEPLREVPPFFSSGRRRCGGGSRGRRAAVRERPARCRHTLQPAICPLPTARSAAA